MTSRGPSCTNHSSNHSLSRNNCSKSLLAQVPSNIAKSLVEKKSQQCVQPCPFSTKKESPQLKFPLFFPVFGLDQDLFFCWISLKPPAWLQKIAEGKLGNPYQRSDKKSQLLQNWARAHPFKCHHTQEIRP